MKYLKPEYQDMADEWEMNYRDEGCSCHISPPCSSCTHEGNPHNLEEDDNAWVESTHEI